MRQYFRRMERCDDDDCEGLVLRVVVLTSLILIWIRTPRLLHELHESVCSSVHLRSRGPVRAVLVLVEMYDSIIGPSLESFTDDNVKSYDWSIGQDGLDGLDDDPS